MFYKLLALTLILASGVAAAVVGTSRAQETGSLAISTVESGTTATVGDTTITVPPSITVIEQTPKADMRFWPFVHKRRELRHKANEKKNWKAHKHVHKFKIEMKEIKPWYRQENLNYWRSIVQKWRAADFRWHRFDTHNFDWILKRAAITFGISFSWIHACSHDEANTHDRGPIWNSKGSGAFGWMQFMSGTFYGNVDAAFASARNRGFHVPGKYKKWSSRVGQAVTASYMFKIGQSGQWTGAACN